MTAAATRPRTGLPAARLVAFLIGLTAVRLVVAASFGLVDDEAYYRLWSLNLAPGYLDHAPMVAWLIAAGRAIAGDGPLGVRLAAPIGTLAGSLLLWRTVALSSGRATADRAALWFNAAILVGAGALLATPDGPSTFFWGATLWALAELVASKNPNWWFAVGLAAGGGLLSKYTVLFLGPGLVVWLLATRDGRRWILEPRLWIGGAIALAMFAPVVWWNAEHQWVSFVKQFGRTAVEGWRPEKLGELIGVQILLIGPAMVPFLALGARRLWARRDAAALVPLATSAPLVVYLLFHSLHGGVEGNWPAPLYPAFAWIAAVGAEEVGGRLARLARLVAPIGLGLVALLWLHVTTPWLALPPRFDPTAQTRGWDDFARDLVALGDKEGAAAFGGRNYTLSSQLAIRLGATRTAPFDERERYIDLPVLDPRRVCGPILYVDREGRDPTELLGGHWRSVTPLGALERRAGGRLIETHPVLRLADPTDCDADLTRPRPAGA
ncbi:MAG: glycosyltransferase family 39 protein [Hyphomicrobiales bacterium]|nr:glycosyltransferase family 39 protein [Hyphomicrobiales bacterium]